MESFFSINGIPLSDLKQYMHPVSDSYLKRVNNEGVFLGYPQTNPHPIALETMTNYLNYNENHVGIFTGVVGSQSETRMIEGQFIQMLGEWYGDRTVDGYITSGGTEGNIMGIWIGKTKLDEKRQKKPTLLIKTPITHYENRQPGRRQNPVPVRRCRLHASTNLAEYPFLNTCPS